MKSSILKQIEAYKRQEIDAAKSILSFSEILAQCNDLAPTRPFAKTLIEKQKSQKNGLIAEIKKASPSKGIIRSDFDPKTLAIAYEKGGADCLSVLTDAPSFQGAPGFLHQVRGSVALPLLRKDFLYDPYQVAEARLWGADCILIIMAAVTDEEAVNLEDQASNLQLDTLIEVHNEEELERALTRLKSPLIGINNRDLNTFETTLDTSHQLASLIPDDRYVVSESGIFTYEDICALNDSNIRLFLVGESLMRQADVTQATRILLGTA